MITLNLYHDSIDGSDFTGDRLMRLAEKAHNYEGFMYSSVMDMAELCAHTPAQIREPRIWKHPNRNVQLLAAVLLAVDANERYARGELKF